MTINKKSIWSVKFSYQDSARTYRHNRTVSVIASSARQALEALVHRHPDAEVWSINHESPNEIIYCPNDNRELDMVLAEPSKK